MLRLFIFVLTLPLFAQLTIDTVAGGKIRTGVPASEVGVVGVAGVTFDPAGKLVFCESGNHVIRRISADGIIETIAGTGVAGFSGDGGPASSAFLNAPAEPHYDLAGNLYF